MRVTFEVCDSRNGNGDFSERMLVRSCTARTNLSLALIYGMVQLLGKNWMVSVVLVDFVVGMYIV